MLIEKNNLPLVAMDFMNEVHKEDADIINELYDAVVACEHETDKKSQEEQQQQITELYQKWFEHTTAHFAGEEKEMAEKNFPPYPIHKGEHDNSLEQMKQVFDSWQKNHETRELKNYLEAYTEHWLIDHINTLDTVTAMFLKNFS